MLTRASTIVCRRTLLRANSISQVPQELTMCRCIHLISQMKKTPRSNSLLDLHRNYRITGIPLIRYASTNETPPQINPYDEIPDPPAPLEEIVENVIKVHPNGEATFESIGLGSFTPPGLIQQALEYLHISQNIPWWGTIVIGTLCVRLLMFPVIIISQKNMINMSNHMPTIQKMQTAMTEARQSGDYVESARTATEMMQFMKANKISAFKNVTMPIIQAPVFISFFLSLRGMANAPVESLKEGGFWWMQDLTVHDPYYIMPIVTCLTMYTTIELGSEGTNLKTMGLMRYVVRAVPFVILPFMIHFPGTILTYWVSTNFISLLQTGVLKIPYIRNALKMPVVINHPKNAITKKKFTVELKDSWTNITLSQQLANRERADVVQFNAAAKAAIVKTFKHDPTKRKEKQSVILGKSR